MKISYISLGCPKNEVDLEYILGGLQGEAQIVDNVEQADVVIINTCAFINDAKQESIDHILNAIELRQERPDLKVLVSGCLPQRYKEELQKEIPEIDEFFGSRDVLTTLRQIQNYLQLPGPDADLARHAITPGHFAYLKIAEGCDNRCSYCAIPLIKGGYVSRPMNEVVAEANRLAESGVKELLLVAQDTTLYGKDLGQSNGLVDLLHQLERIDGLQWVRLLYTHPAHWQPEMITAVSEIDKVLNYIDLPVQHISGPILKSMGRHVTKSQTTDLIMKLKAGIPGLILRTSVITGYPGETDKDFRELVRFIEEMRFDRLGVFTYSPEDGTRAVKLKDDVPEQVKRERKQEIMEIQADIALEKNKSLVGSVETVLVDQEDLEIGRAIGRTFRDAPDIDNTVLMPLGVKQGEMCKVRITGADIYDLHAEIL